MYKSNGLFAITTSIILCYSVFLPRAIAQKCVAEFESTGLGTFAPSGNYLLSSGRIWCVSEKTKSININERLAADHRIFAEDIRKQAFLDDASITVVHIERTDDPPSRSLRANIFDVKSGRRKKEIKVSGYALELSQNGRYILTRSSADTTVAIVHDLLADQKSELKGHKEPLALIAAITADGKRVATMSDTGVLHVWQLPEGKVVWETALKEKEAPDFLTFADAGQMLVSHRTGNPDWCFFDLKKNEIRRARLGGFSGCVSPDGKWFLTYQRDVAADQGIGLYFVRTSDWKTGDFMKFPIENGGWRWKPGLELVFSSDGRYFANRGGLVRTDETGKEFSKNAASIVRVYETPKLEP